MYYWLDFYKPMVAILHQSVHVPLSIFVPAPIPVLLEFCFVLSDVWFSAAYHCIVVVVNTCNFLFLLWVLSTQNNCLHSTAGQADTMWNLLHPYKPQLFIGILISLWLNQLIVFIFNFNLHWHTHRVHETVITTEMMMILLLYVVKYMYISVVCDWLDLSLGQPSSYCLWNDLFSAWYKSC